MRALNIFLLAVLYLNPSFVFGAVSYRDLVMTNSSAVTLGLSEECINSLRKHINSDLSFSTPSVFKFTTPIGELSPINQSDNFKFYHYTNSEKMKLTSKNRDFEELFRFLRNPQREAPMDWNLYVAGDDESSKSYGRIKTRISVNTDTYVFDATTEFDKKDVFSFLKSRSDTLNLIENELVEKFNYLSSCRTRQPQFGILSYPENFGILTQLILVDSGVSMISYLGLKSPSKRKDIMSPLGYLVPEGDPIYWYQIIDPKAILEIEILN